MRPPEEKGRRPLPVGTGSSQPHGTTKSLRQEKGVGTGTHLLPASQNGGLQEVPRAWGSKHHGLEWQGLEIPGEQPLTLGRLD